MKTLKLIPIIIFEIIMIQCANAQDKLFFKSGNEQTVVIKKETSDEIYFVKTANDSTIFKILKYALKQINYANGDRIFFTANNAEPSDPETAGWKTGVPNATYYCWIYGDPAFSNKVRRGFINSVADSGIVFAVSATRNTFMIRDKKLNVLNISNIEQIKLRRKGSVGKGMLMGAGIGFLIGGILGATGIPDYGIFGTLPPEENAATGGILFSIPGMIIGGIAGSVRIKIPINRNQPAYEKLKKVIASYSTAE